MNEQPMTTPTLHIHHSEDLDALLDTLADILRSPVADPFAPELIAVPTTGISDHLIAGLGRRLGIAANVEVVFPGRLIQQLLDTASDDSWSLPALTWPVLDVIRSTDGSVEGRTVPGRGERFSDWALARRIADLFDSYAYQRPRMIEAWAAGIDTDGTLLESGDWRPLPEALLWQPALWRAVRERIGRPSLAERLDEVLAGVVDGSTALSVPSRFFVFGVAGLSNLLLRVLEACATRAEIHVFLRHPSSQAWGTNEVRLGGSLNPRASVAVGAGISHSLLESWGRPSLEARMVLDGHRAVEWHPVARRRPFSSSLLGCLQREISSDSLWVDPVAPDNSIQVHACHGPARQVEILRDALAHAFIDDPSLKPHEVLVLCPDIVTFAPLVEAVFGRGRLPIPVEIGDRSLVRSEPMVEVLQSALSLLAGRVSASDVLNFAQLEPVRRRFGWSSADIEGLADWFADLGVRWGLSADHRRDWVAPDGRPTSGGPVETGSWRLVVDQLLAGVASAAPVPRFVVGDTRPFDAVGADDLSRLGGLADLLEGFLRMYPMVSIDRPLGEWSTLLHAILDDFCALDSSDEWRRSALHGQVDRLLGGATGFDVGPVSLGDVLQILEAEIASRPGWLRHRSGSVTVTSLVPEAGVPARVVCILGFDESVARGLAFDGDDILGVTACLGERQSRNESRQLLLDALLAAGDRLIITCNGADVTTNAEVPFTVPLAELLENLDRLLGDGGSIMVRHPRHGFDERALVAGGLVDGATQPFTFDDSQLTAALARREADDTSAVVAAPILPPSPEETFESLIEAADDAARAFLRGRLTIELPDGDASFEDSIPLSTDPLTASEIGRVYLEQRLSCADADEWEARISEEWTAAILVDSRIPPSRLGEEFRDEIEGVVDQMVQRAEELGWRSGAVGSVDVVLPATVDIPIVLETRIDGVDLVQGRIFSVGYRRHRPAHKLQAGLRLAVLTLWNPEIDWTIIDVSRHGDKVTPSAWRIPGDPAERSAKAVQFLRVMRSFADWTHRDAVPFFDSASEAMAGSSLHEVNEGLRGDLKRGAWREFLWGEYEYDEILNMPIEPSDPVELQDHLDPKFPTSRARAAARWVWSTFAASFVVIDPATLKVSTS